MYIRKIVEAYRSFKDVEKFARVITIDEVREADYNLSPSRFVSVAEEESYREVGEILEELRKLEEERRAVEERINKIFEGI
jgi:type I restriction enzyme M protein